MPTSLPPSVREHFGEPAAEDFARWLEETLQERIVRRDERPDRKGGSTPGVYREVLSRLDVIDERFEQIDGRFEQMEKRFDERLDEMQKRFDARFNEMEKRFDARFSEMEERFAEMQDQFESRSRQVDKRFEGMDAKLDRMNDRILSMTQWLIGLIALFGTLVTALLAVTQFGGNGEQRG